MSPTVSAVYTLFAWGFQKLQVQDSVSPTRPDKRGWFINPMGMKEQLPVWIIFASIIPAFLIFILLFMEVEITEWVVGLVSY